MKNAESCPNRRFGGPGVFQGKVNLGFALIGQWNVGFDEELAASKSARAETRLGPFGPGHGDPTSRCSWVSVRQRAETARKLPRTAT
jgi:hypothetical protein